MSLSPTTTTIASSQLTPDQLTVIVASVSCLVFFVVILILLAVLYRRDPLCCKVRTYQEPQQYTDAPPQFHHSRHNLVGYPYNEQSVPMAHDNVNFQHPAPLFLIGKPSSYHLSPFEGPLPRLPSYESVRKKDRQQQIHNMIADRFGLNSHTQSEPPPTYEETLCHAVDISPEGLQTANTPPGTHSDSGLPPTVPQEEPSSSTP